MQENDQRLMDAMRAVFVPLVSLMLKNGVKTASLVEQLKLAFVEVARDEHGNQGQPASVSKIARLTGLSRAHVVQLLSQATETVVEGDFATPIESVVLSTWMNSPDYLDDVGKPRVLSFGPGPGSFSELVRDGTGTEAGAQFLNRLSEADCISVDNDNRVTLTKREYLTSEDLPRIFAIGLLPLVTTMADNWGRAPGTGFCQRVTHSARIDPGKAGTMRRISRDRIVSFIEDVDDLICSIETDEPEPFYSADGKELSRLGIGAYYFEIEK